MHSAALRASSTTITVALPVFPALFFGDKMAVIEVFMAERPKIGLVLGGGGSRGIAHIGVLSVLARERIPIDLIVGTSMGGIVGALYASGVSPDDMAEGLDDMRGTTLLNMNLFSARARQRMLEDQLGVIAGKTFADIRIPLTVMTVDMVHGREIAINDGPLLPALLATSAVPGVFPPVDIDGMQLADGGVIDSLATHVAFEQGAEKVIAVDVYPRLETANPWVDPLGAILGFQLPFMGSGSETKPGVVSAIWRAVRVMTWHLHQQRLAAHPPDVLLRPSVEHYASMDFKDIRGPIMAGAAEAEGHLAAIKALLSHTPEGHPSG
jgi:NTE family protein